MNVLSVPVSLSALCMHFYSRQAASRRDASATHTVQNSTEPSNTSPIRQCCRAYSQQTASCGGGLVPCFATSIKGAMALWSASFRSRYGANAFYPQPYGHSKFSARQVCIYSITWRHIQNQSVHTTTCFCKTHFNIIPLMCPCVPRHLFCFGCATKILSCIYHFAIVATFLAHHLFTRYFICFIIFLPQCATHSYTLSSSNQCIAITCCTRAIWTSQTPARAQTDCWQHDTCCFEGNVILCKRLND